MKIEKVKYRGFEIEIERSGDKYKVVYNIGESYLEVPEFRTRYRAIRWDRKNIDRYISETE